MDTVFFQGKNVLVMGLGRFAGGVDSARFAHRYADKIIVTDLLSANKLKPALESLEEIDDIEFCLGGHKYSHFEWADIIIVNPAVPPESKYLKFARSKGKVLTSQVEIFFQLCPARIVGITGSNGKSTTAALTAHLLKTAEGKELENSKVWLSGNIGEKPLLAVLDELKPDDIVVLELSSFQLEQLARIKKAPDISLLVNLTPNHLDRHKTFENYCDAKENIFRYQKKTFGKPVSIFCGEDEIANKWYEKYKKDENRICLKYSAGDVPEDLKGKFPLTGKANLSNLSAALTVAGCFDISKETISENLGDFKTLRHRLELVTEIKGVKWYNDSISTTPESTIAAIKAFSSPKILIAGGYDKKLDFRKMARQIAENCKAAVLTGVTAGKIRKEIEQFDSETIIKTATNLQQAVQTAYLLGEKGDVVLLSPGCASYDMFENFQQRGEQFEECVKNLE